MEYNKILYVQFAGYTSQCMEIECGVPQGSVLGPKLFILYINDICESQRYFSLFCLQITSHLVHTKSICVLIILLCILLLQHSFTWTTKHPHAATQRDIHSRFSGWKLVDGVRFGKLNNNNEKTARIPHYNAIKIRQTLLFNVFCPDQFKNLLKWSWYERGMKTFTSN